MQHKDGSSILESFTYTYDKENNILSTTHVNNLLEDGKKINETRVYAYNEYNFLLSTSIRYKTTLYSSGKASWTRIK